MRIEIVVAPGRLVVARVEAVTERPADAPGELTAEPGGDPMFLDPDAIGHAVGGVVLVIVRPVIKVSGGQVGFVVQGEAGGQAAIPVVTLGVEHGAGDAIDRGIGLVFDEIEVALEVEPVPGHPTHAGPEDLAGGFGGFDAREAVALGVDGGKLVIVAGDQGEIVEGPPGGLEIDVVGFEILREEKSGIPVDAAGRVGSGIEAVIEIVVAEFVVVTGPEIETANGVPIDAGGVFLREPVVIRRTRENINVVGYGCRTSRRGRPGPAARCRGRKGPNW